MRFLLDNCIRRDVTTQFRPYSCEHVVDLGWSGYRNGELVKIASEQFDVLVTVDKNMPFQTNLRGLPWLVAVLDIRSNLRPELEAGIAILMAQLSRLAPGEFTIIQVGGED